MKSGVSRITANCYRITADTSLMIIGVSRLTAGMSSMIIGVSRITTNLISRLFMC